MNPKQPIYKTSDLGCATALTTAGCNLFDIQPDRTNPRKAIFIFEDDHEVQKIVQAYWNGSLKLPVQQVLQQQRLLKNRIFDLGKSFGRGNV